MIRLRLVAILVLTALVAACGSSGPTSDATRSSTPSTAPSSAAPASAGPTDGTSAPSEAPSPAASETPVESGSPTGSGSPDASAQPTAADACTGDQSIHDFYVSVANAVDWPVLCGVLPSGWFVGTGSYRLANGGKLVISYKGPGGATFALSEGSFCQDAGGCVPSGTDAGDAAFGTLSGTLVALDSGDWAIVVDRGASPSWLLVTHGLDQATTVSLAGALHEVAP